MPVMPATFTVIALPVLDETPAMVPAAVPVLTRVKSSVDTFTTGSLKVTVKPTEVSPDAGLPATLAGLASLPISILMTVGSSWAGSLAGRIGPRVPMTVGPLLMGAASLLMLFVTEPFTYWTQLLPGILLFGVGLTVTVSPLTAAILGAIDPSHSGIASAVCGITL